MEKKKQESQDSKSKWLILAICVVVTAILASAITYVVVKNDNKVENKENTENTDKTKEEEKENKSSKESECAEKLLDGSCLSDNSQVYKNEDKGIKFNYPEGWKIGEEKQYQIAESSKQALFVRFENEDNTEIHVTLENPDSDKGSEGLKKIGSKNYKINGYDIEVITLETDENFYESMGLELPDKNKMIIAQLNSEIHDFYSNYAFILRAPEDNFEKYSKFIMEAISTFQNLDTVKESSCTELIDGSCLTEDNTQVYKNNRLGIEFNYPKNWEIIEETPTEADLESESIENDRYVGINLKFRDKENGNIVATLENPTYETVYGVADLSKEENYETDDYNIKVYSYNQENELINNDEGQNSTNYTIITADLTSKPVSLEKSFRFTLQAPENTNTGEYNDFIMQTTSTFKKK